MGRLCERPGCSEPASVAYGMRTEDLVFWLAAVAGDDAPPRNLLCGRHADSMVVPRGWTLDDQRDPDLHLFRPPPPAVDEQLAGPRRRRSRRPADVEQLVLEPAATAVAAVAPLDLAPDPVEPQHAAASSDPVEPEPWMPQFDHSDDLDGLLSARSPLLARAFRGDERPR
ncbi:MAG: DUF3499 family protein [Actinomycetota bacterium]